MEGLPEEIRWTKINARCSSATGPSNVIFIYKILVNTKKNFCLCAKNTELGVVRLVKGL